MKTISIAAVRLFLLLMLGAGLSACSDVHGGPGTGNAPSLDQGVVWLIDPAQIVDGGPGVDGIPAINNPVFEEAAASTLGDDQRVVGVFFNGVAKAYPHEILDWHEIVNDEFAGQAITTSYCPLTASAVAWLGDMTHADPTFGTSGLLHNSNLLLYDRETRSLWSQLLQVSVNGQRVEEFATSLPLVETSFGTWKEMYPDSLVMTRDTGHNREYGTYPYGNYLEIAGLLFPVNNVDQRLHPKTRVHAVRVDTVSRVYQLAAFGDETQVINDQLGDGAIVIIGNTAKDFSASFSRVLDDGTILNFTGVSGELPAVMQDDEGNTWDVFGKAISGPRSGAQLDKTTSMTIMWFGWVAYFDSVEIYFNQTT
jgi:hypothetical protein